MPATHHIDEQNKLIVTTWEGEPTVQDLSEAFKKYQNKIKSKPEFQNYDELVDFTKIEGFKLSSDGLGKLAQTASSFDKSIGKSKLAIIVKTTLAFGLARMYEIFRSFGQRKKEIRVFKDRSSALNWLSNNKNDQA